MYTGACGLFGKKKISLIKWRYGTRQSKALKHLEFLAPYVTYVVKPQTICSMKECQKEGTFLLQPSRLHCIIIISKMTCPTVSAQQKD